MTWTYSISDLATSVKDQVRLLVGDINASSPLLQDEEINQAIAVRNSLYGAASECCRSLSARFATQITTKAGDSQINYSDIAKAFARQAISYDQRAASSGSGLPYAGGISVTDKENQEQNTDRVSPQFNIGMDDNLSTPVSPVGNETPDESPQSGG